MSKVTVKFERTIAAPVSVVYDCIADHVNHHPHFLPPQFKNFQVLEGGYGAGTVTKFSVGSGTATMNYHMQVEEPEPGRVMLERDRLSDTVTTWRLSDDTGGCRIQLETTWTPARGVAGMLERLFAPSVMKSMYADELNRLERYARELSLKSSAFQGSRS